jgi:hypothetical protein
MAKQVSYVCDRCGHSQADDKPGTFDGKRNMNTVSLLVHVGHRDIYPYSTSVGLDDGTMRASKLWCDECLLATGLTKIVKLPDRNPRLAPASPGLEDIIRDWIADAVKAAL